MQPLLLTLLIGTAFAMVNAAPAQNKLQRFQAVLESDDDQAKAQIVGRLVGRLLPSVTGAFGNEKELAAVQEDDDAEVQKIGKVVGRFIKRHGGTLGGILAGGLLGGGGGGEEPAKLQDEDDDDDMAKAQIIHHLVKFLG